MIFPKSLIAVLLLICIITSVFSACSENGKDNTQTTDNNVSTEENTSDTSQSSDLLELTKDDLECIEEYLNKADNNGFIGENLYLSPNDIDLSKVFYDGAGINEDFSKCDTAEKQDVLNAMECESFFNPPIKIEFSKADSLLIEKCGVSLKSFKNKTIPNFYYLEDYDAYYAMHGDTSYIPVTVLSGKFNNLSDEYIVDYKLENRKEIFTVILRKVENGYQFVSNTVTSSDSSSNEAITEGVFYFKDRTGDEYELIINGDKVTINVTNESKSADFDCYIKTKGIVEGTLTFADGKYTFVCMKSLYGESYEGTQIEEYKASKMYDILNYVGDDEYEEAYRRIFNGEMVEDFVIGLVDESCIFTITNGYLDSLTALSPSYVGGIAQSYTFYPNGMPKTNVQYNFDGTVMISNNFNATGRY